VSLAKAFLARPQVVLLDEPTASLDPDIAHEVRRFVRDQRDNEGVSILYTSHNMDEVAEICDRVLFLDRGKIAAVGTPEELAASVASVRIHLKVTHGLDDVIRQTERQSLPVYSDGDQTVVEIAEPGIAGFLMALAEARVEYSEIHLDKPTLEDYFLELARRSNQAAQENGRERKGSS
jgi:ABC-2 type transport system ATP-binding protein